MKVNILYLFTYYEAFNGESVVRAVTTRLLSNLVQIHVRLSDISK